MQTWIALFRGINVGGNNPLPMASLRVDLESLGMVNVRTYIQSGNVVFEAKSKDAESLSQSIADFTHTQYGFRPKILLIKREDFQKAVARNPYPEAEANPKTLHLFFLEQPASLAVIPMMEKRKSSTEHFHLTDRVFYLHAPDGVGRSKLAATAEKILGVVTTARNYRTVSKLLEMIE